MVVDGGVTGRAGEGPALTLGDVLESAGVAIPLREAEIDAVHEVPGALRLGHEVGGRLYGSLALAALALTKGAHILRVHDVAETVDVVRMIAAVEAAQ